ncbi:hypothetical protein GQ651_08040 [Alphaproteobacteria bacterium GH1-50]|uniref:Uncharacterized protein n=1 Tax=Kangsaoukella pontilimi TaxID=2691042 RepID=A0A7C9MJI1_9RHOB|nr:hypothetical protein [Kangsaoukella pontilimi]MXQ07795.1 hypothetical protein [Kangsaoukella pontilimi]
MLYIAVTPAPVYTALLIALCAGLAALLWRRSGIDRPGLLTALFWIVPLQATIALLGLWFTAERSIAMRACLTGIWGFPAATLLFGLSVISLSLASAFGGRAFRARLAPFRPAIVTALILQTLVILVHMRSALLCTV